MVCRRSNSFNGVRLWRTQVIKWWLDEDIKNGYIIAECDIDNNKENILIVHPKLWDKVIGDIQKE